MNKQETYRRVKIQWWIILIFWGIYAWMIFAYIHQWGNNPIPKIVLIILAVLWLVISGFIIAGRSTLTVDDKYLIIKIGLETSWEIKLHVKQIKDVSVETVSFRTYTKVFSPKGRLYPFDYTRQTVKIQSKNDKIFQVAIKDAQKVKEEIEKRMLTN